MEIKHVRDFDIESLIGNSGGYIGLFTGYALLQLPNLLSLVYQGIVKIFCRQHKTVIYDQEVNRKEDKIWEPYERMKQDLQYFEQRGYLIDTVVQ